MSAGDTLYLKIGKNVVVTDRRVTLGDVAKMECTDQAALRQIRQKKLYSFRAEDEQKKKNTLVVFSVLKVIELIHEDYPNLDISNEGESDFIVEYVKSPEKPVWMNCLKTVILCILIFFGAAFTIMAFNNDVGVTDVLQVLSADHGNGIKWHHRTGNLLQYWTSRWDYCVFQPCGTQENHA